jgi:hypothetical protein
MVHLRGDRRRSGLCIPSHTAFRYLAGGCHSWCFDGGCIRVAHPTRFDSNTHLIGAWIHKWLSYFRELSGLREFDGFIRCFHGLISSATVGLAGVAAMTYNPLFRPLRIMPRLTTKPTLANRRTPLAVVILAVPPLEELDLVGPLEVFAGANLVLGERGPAYDIRVFISAPPLERPRRQFRGTPSRSDLERHFSRPRKRCQRRSFLRHHPTRPRHLQTGCRSTK